MIIYSLALRLARHQLKSFKLTRMPLTGAQAGMTRTVITGMIGMSLDLELRLLRVSLGFRRRKP